MITHSHPFNPNTTSLAESIPDDVELSELIENIQGFRNFREV